MRFKGYFYTFFFITVFFVWLVKLDSLSNMDQIIYDWSNTLSTPSTDFFWRMFTIFGDTEMLAILSLIIVFFLYSTKKIQEVILYLFLMSTGIVVTLILKRIMKVERPGEVHYIDFWGLGNNIVSYSFPSGHAMKSLLLFGFIVWIVHTFYRNQKYIPYLKMVLVLFILLCGLGQVFLQSHYLSDVIGGYLIGMTCIFLSLWLYTRRKNQITFCT
ncbi:phosphatase PAP2 family protein [Salirhabdus sp. Marseille-P4669]|uniref:phosphatase PAP2 family protein n=1 Tax=Salirhabdus sp. Marseille-P4669 TaxID=2042310 RepID=UPI000C7E78F9|nr:phosphatase PAP2 family protein [Salirhabdus sp. Marseille-P4669]